MSNTGKIVLTAFHGNLRSAPLDWPLNIPPTVQMLLDIDLDNSPFPANLLPVRKVGTFKRNGLHEILPNGDSAAIYVLVGIA